MPKFIDLTGKKFGYLSVLRLGGRKNGCTAFVCRCECGVEKSIRSCALIQKRIVSCGKCSKQDLKTPIAWTRVWDCFICTSHKKGSGNGIGYPSISIGGRKKMGIHRLILTRRMGKLPRSIVAMHSCDNKFCIRPDHIVPGTISRNIKDAAERGLMPRGEKSGQSKLREDQVRQILSSSESNSKLATLFRVTSGAIGCIKRRETWRHIQ